MQTFQKRIGKTQFVSDVAILLKLEFSEFTRSFH